MALPFGLLSTRDRVMATTVRRIETELVGPGGGVRRYLGDTYYGGGDWILLTAWLEWYRATRGDLAGARRARSWIEAAATPHGQLPEQLTGAAQQPDMVQPWIDKRGPVATPLLWSHAMYLILADAIHAPDARAAKATPSVACGHRFGSTEVVRMTTRIGGYCAS